MSSPIAAVSITERTKSTRASATAKFSSKSPFKVVGDVTDLDCPVTKTIWRESWWSTSRKKVCSGIAAQTARTANRLCVSAYDSEADLEAVKTTAASFAFNRSLVLFPSGRSLPRATRERIVSIPCFSMLSHFVEFEVCCLWESCVVFITFFSSEVPIFFYDSYIIHPHLPSVKAY